MRHLTEAHGGSVSAASDGTGQGATFVVRLPLDPTRGRPPAATPIESRPLANPRLLRGARVLVADDEPDARELTRFILESCGGDVVAVASAAAALGALHEHVFDALVADIGMPDQDGYSLIRAIRKLPASQHGTIPAIAVTAYATLSDRQLALAAGFTAHIGKPVDPQQLVATVAEALGVRP